MEEKKVHIEGLESNLLSHLKTSHRFEAYSDFTSIEQFLACLEWATSQNREVFILGNGSNTLFIRKKVKSLILKNALPAEIRDLGENRWEISSSVLIMSVLTHCRARSLDSFYFLASLPATIGGALAMNAGRGKAHPTLNIYKFVESVTYVEKGKLITKACQEIPRSYRQTPFRGVQSTLIVSAIFRFPPTQFVQDPIVERLKWVKENQDNSAPNCGSVFCEGNLPILNRLKGLSLFKAAYSSRTPNWILNRSSHPMPVRALIWIAIVLHRLTFKKIDLELIPVR